MNKFLPPCEPPLNLGLFPFSTALLAPRAQRPESPWNPGSRRAPPGKSQKVTRNVEPRWGRSSEEKGCFPFKNERAERAGRGVEGDSDAPGPGQAGTAGGSGQQPRIPNLSRQRSAAQEPAGGGGAEHGAASPGFRQAAPSRARERKEACLRAGKGRGEEGEAKSPPKIETTGRNEGKHKGSQRGAGARAPSIHAPESCGSSAGWGGTRSAGLETGHASIQEVTCEHRSWLRL